MRVRGQEPKESNLSGTCMLGREVCVESQEAEPEEVLLLEGCWGLNMNKLLLNTL